MVYFAELFISFLCRPSSIAMNALKKVVQTGWQLQFLSNFGTKSLTAFYQTKNLGWLKCYFGTNIQEEEIDDNERALKELDITLLKPHPEWRNVAAGPVWGKGNEYFELLWKHWLDESFIEKYQKQHDQDWKEYVEKFGETPSDYLNSDQYNELYNGKDTWISYKRNRKGFIPRQENRTNCISKGEIKTGSPCPLCRDHRLLMTYNNLTLLNQYIDQQTGELHHHMRTGICKAKQKRLFWSFAIAKDLGYLQRIVPFVKFNLDDYELNHYVL